MQTDNKQLSTDAFGIDFKREVYNYHKDLHENDRGMGGSIHKRVRERFNLTSDQVVDIVREMKTHTDSKEVLRLKMEYQQYDDGSHICLAYENGDWYADLGKESDEAYLKSKFLLLAVNEYDTLKEQNTKLLEDKKLLLDALKKIENWEMPVTGQFWDKEKKQPMSYAAAYGSNGERDYIKQIVAKIIKQVS